MCVFIRVFDWFTFHTMNFVCKMNKKVIEF